MLEIELDSQLISSLTVRGASNGGVNPNYVPVTQPLRLWLDASDLSTITKDGSDLVSQWDDKSGNNNNAIQGTAVSQPAFISNAINGKSIIRSDGNDGMEYPNLGLTGLASVTIFMVLNISDSSSGSDSILAFGSGSESRLETGAGGGATIGDVTARSTSYIVSGTVLATGFNNSNNILTLTTNGTTVIAKKNGVQTFSGAQAGNWSTGAGNYAIFVTNTPNRNIIMDIGEILIYTGTFPSTSIIRVENYLSNKWGI